VKDNILLYNSNPKLCKFCNAILPYNKRWNDFCNHSCCASFNNKGILRRRSEPKICLSCSNKTFKNDKFCSQKCMTEFNWNKSKKELVDSGRDPSVRNTIAKRYLIELHKGKCQLCFLSEWQNQAMPLVLDHIDGNSYNNLLSNLRVICNNCDAIQPTYKGRNKGNGRFKRAERYKFEKELLGDLDKPHFRH
jgi:hypothetical protein